MTYYIFFDESGDLGWKLNRPYKQGGSSTYFTIAYLLIPKDKVKLISRFIKKFHKDRGGIHKEIKGARIRKNKAISLSRRILNEIILINEDITIGAITVDKKTCPEPIVNTKKDHILYDFMIRKGITKKIIDMSDVEIIPDKKSVPSVSLNSCSDILKSDLWLKYKSEVEISYVPQESHNVPSLMFIDWVANFIWRKYENNSPEPYDILRPHIHEELIF